MPVDLHQRLSEFSYGYGVTREVEQSLKSIGLTPTPFLPSLVHEGSLAWDVAFDRPGRALLLQFKLGQALERFVRKDKTKPRPALAKRFWRYKVDTAERDGQFDLLFKAELSGAEVYYVAPRLTGWDSYVTAFQADDVLGCSLLMKPSEIDSKLAEQGEPDGWHQIDYDETKVFVSSEPIRLEEQDAQTLAHTIRNNIEQYPQRIGVALKEVYFGLERSRDIRRREPDAGRLAILPPPQPELAPSAAQLVQNRSRRLNDFRARAGSEEDAIFTALGFEAWATGAQVIAVTLD